MDDIALRSYKRPQHQDYVDSAVAFVDILGFDSKVRNIKSESDFGNIANILYLLKEIERVFGEQNTEYRNLNITSISDSLILTMPFNDPQASAMSLTVTLQLLQYLLLERFETLTRGYLTRGPVYHKDNIIFGRGYSEAYENEGQVGHAPRIVVDPIFVSEAKTTNLSTYVDHILNHIIEDSSDGCYFIDYLRPAGSVFKMQKDIVTEREKIKKFIQNALTVHSNEKKIFRKYKWLQNYFAVTEKYFTP